MKGIGKRKSGLLLADDLQPLLYAMIIGYYMRYVLLRAARYTNRKSEAAEIALYTLLTVCALTRKLHHSSHLGAFIDVMVDMIGQDITGHNLRLDSRRELEGAQMLVPDETMYKLVEGLNSLDEHSRQMLVLSRMEMMSPKTLSQIYDRPVRKVKARIRAAEKKLTQYLAAFPESRPVCLPGDIPCRLAHLSMTLDSQLMLSIAECALAFLTKGGKDFLRVCKYPPPWSLN
ncbi:MAG: sigma-70 family RNA polymerase sigma factor [Planctomycetota bacterium]